jgi:type IV pilus assembly protein PilX
VSRSMFDTRGRKVGQRGVTLVVVLLFMLALTAVVLFSARSALLGETLARNQVDEQVAREAAESALRDAEKDIFLLEGTMQAGAVCERGVNDRPLFRKEGHFTADCRAGQCMFINQEARLGMNYASATSDNPAQSEVWWPVNKGGRWNNDAETKPSKGSNDSCGTFTGGVPLGTYTGQAPLQGVARQPEYLIEFVRKSQDVVYRVTARGFGVREGTEIVLQSYVRAEQ